MGFHVFKIYHGGVVVEVMDFRAQKYRHDDGDYTVEEDLGCDKACSLCDSGTLV